MIFIKKFNVFKIAISTVFSFVLIFVMMTENNISVKADVSDIKNWDYSYTYLKNYPYDYEHGTSLKSRYKYENGRIYMQIEMGTYGSTGYDHIWLKDPNGTIYKTWTMSRANRSTGATDIYNRDGRTVYRRELDWVEVWGAKPHKPNFNLDYNSYAKIMTLNFLGSSCGTSPYTYDYYWSSGSSVDFEPGDGHSTGAEDYIVDFYYWINDTTSNDGVIISPGVYITPGVCSNKGENIDISQYLFTDNKPVTIHVCARSYTGLISDINTVTIDKVTINYDKNNDMAKGTMNTQYNLFGYKMNVANNEYYADGYTFIGWNTSPDGKGLWYNEGDEIWAYYPLSGPNETHTLYAQWDKPTATVEPTENNTSFTNNDVTYYKDPVEFEVKGTDKYFPINSVSIWTDKDNIRIDCKGSSYKKTYDKSYCVEPDIITVYGQSRTESGVSEVVSKDVHIDITPPEITKCVVDYGQKKVNIGATDSQSGIGNIKLEYLKDGTWYTEDEYETKETEYDECDTSIYTNSNYNMYVHRIVVTDHLGNSSYSSEFYVVPLTLTSSITKLNGDTAYNNQTLTYLAGGDLNAYLNVKITGYPDSVKYEFANELGQPVDEHVVTYDVNGEVVESKQFMIPWQVEHDKNYFVKVTAYRGNESISTIEYVKLVDIDTSIFKSVILYQSGQHD